MRILGVNVGNKESSLALIDNGVIVAAMCEERLSRQRYDERPPLLALERALRSRNWTLDDVDLVVGNQSESQFRAQAGLPPRTNPGRVPWRDDGPERHGLHHVSHAAAAFYTSGFSQALVLTVDNHGDDDTLVVFRADAQGLTRIARIPRGPLTVGGIYEEATLQLGFGRGGEGKLMGLAGYAPADPAWAQGLLHLQPDGVTLGSTWRHGHPADEVLRAPWAPIDFGLHAKFAASVQAAIETTVLTILRQAHATTGLTDVCLSGGVALNCSMNGRIGREPWLTGLWVPPSPADPGNALGAALFAAARLGEPVRQRLADGGLGVAWQPQEALEALRRAGEATDAILTRGEAALHAARDLAQGALVGWFEGRSEFGPRALGHRSILGDPRRTDIRDRLNDAKLREGWRPIAPAILQSAQTDWLEDNQPSPFMLLAMQAKPRLREVAPAAVHVDGTVRAQTVTAAATPHYHALIAAFAAATGVPMVLNTSFNQAGEPIVESPADALDCARRSGLDVLYLDGIRVALPPHRQPVDTRKRPQKLAISGPVTFGWQLVAAQLPGCVVDKHEGMEPASQAGVAALGLQPNLDPTLPLLATGAPLDRLQALLAAGERPVFALGPLPGPAQNLPPNAHLGLATLAMDGVRALQRHMPARPQQVAVTLALASTPLADASETDSLTQRLFARLAEGLGLAAHLLLQDMTAVTLRGPWPLPELDAQTADGKTRVHVSLGGEGFGVDVVVDAPGGRVALTRDGRLEVPPPPGATGVRTSDHGMTPFAWGRAVAATLGGAAWPVRQRRVLAAGEAVGDALAHWLQAVLDHPGRLANAERARFRKDANRREQLPEMPPPDAELAAWIAAAIVLHPGAALLSVVDGVRPAAGIENVDATFLTKLCAAAKAMGLTVASSQAYATAAPARQAVRADMAAVQSVFVVRDPAVAAQLVSLDAAMAASPDRATLNALRLEMGALFGYPSCCRANWLELERMTLHEAFTHAIRAATLGAPHGLLNHRPAGKFTQHFPCSYSCSRSIRLAHAVRRAATRDGPRLVRLARAIWPIDELPPVLVHAVDALGLEQDEDVRARQLSALVCAPLVYVDPTRYLCLVGTRLESVPSDGHSEAWLLHGGRVVSSAHLRQGPGAPEEVLLQSQLAAELAGPLARALALGPVRWQQGLPGAHVATRIDGPGLALAQPWQSALLVPFGEADAAAPFTEPPW